MDWLEQLTGLSPDGGSGLYEAALALFLALSIALAAAVWLRRAKAPRGRN
jgi:hypothetical protein